MKVSQITAILKKYPIVTISLAVALFSGIGIMLVKPRIPELQADVSQLDAKLSNLQENANQSVGQKEHVERLERLLDSIKKRVMICQGSLVYPNFQRLDQRYDGVQISSQELLNQWSDSNSGHVKVSSFKPFSYRLDLEGTFEGVLNFVRSLRNGHFFTDPDDPNKGKFFVHIGNFTWSPSSSQEGLVSLKLSLDILGEK